MHKILKVRTLEAYRLELAFDDGLTGTVDLSDPLGRGVFARSLGRSAFEQVRIGSSGELVWGDQVDLCPDALYLRATGKKPEDLFSALRHEPAHA